MSALSPVALLLRNSARAVPKGPTAQRHARSIRLSLTLARNAPKSNSFFATSLQLYLRSHTTYVSAEILPVTKPASHDSMMKHVGNGLRLTRPDLETDPARGYHAGKAGDYSTVHVEAVGPAVKRHKRVKAAHLGCQSRDLRGGDVGRIAHDEIERTADARERTRCSRLARSATPCLRGVVSGHRQRRALDVGAECPSPRELAEQRDEHRARADADVEDAQRLRRASPSRSTNSSAFRSPSPCRGADRASPARWRSAPEEFALAQNARHRLARDAAGAQQRSSARARQSRSFASGAAITSARPCRWRPPKPTRVDPWRLDGGGGKAARGEAVQLAGRSTRRLALRSDQAAHDSSSPRARSPGAR